MTSRWLVLLGCGWIACTPEGPPADDLAKASHDIQFESVDRLGPHRFLASIKHRVVRGGGDIDRTDEAIEIRWQDWDTFEFRRVVDARVQSAVVAVNGRPWTLRSRDRWEPREDAEPYRLDLRQSWNAWEQALEPFGDRVVLEEAGQELFEGRPVRRYRVSLAPEKTPVETTKAGKRRGKAHVPRHNDSLDSLSGLVWIDEGTAVRLQAEVSGELTQRGRSRTIDLQLTRSGIGLDQGITPPKGARRRATPSSLPDAAPSTDSERADGDTTPSRTP